MKVLVYDNPNTMCRECWEKREEDQFPTLLCSYSYHVFTTKGCQIPSKYLFFGANIGPWKAGQAIGDVSILLERKKGRKKNE